MEIFSQDNLKGEQGLSSIIRVGLGVGGFLLYTGPAAAQDDTGASSAASAMCGTGLGDAITFGMGLLVVYLLVKTVFRAVAAFDKMGSTRSDEKYEGKQQLIGSAQTLAGAFLIPIFGVLLDEAGLPTISCVDWAGILYTTPMPLGGPLTIVLDIALTIL